jgi:hypothetical protein
MERKERNRVCCKSKSYCYLYYLKLPVSLVQSFWLSVEELTPASMPSRPLNRSTLLRVSLYITPSHCHHNKLHNLLSALRVYFPPQARHVSPPPELQPSRDDPLGLVLLLWESHSQRLGSGSSSVRALLPTIFAIQDEHTHRGFVGDNAGDCNADFSASRKAR